MPITYLPPQNTKVQYFSELAIVSKTSAETQKLSNIM